MGKRLWLNRYEVKGDVTEITLWKPGFDPRVCLIDTEDLEKVSRYVWTVQFNSKRPYYWWVGSHLTAEGKIRKVLLHRLVMDAPTGMDVDHIHNDTLDNRKSQLRIINRQGNAQNRKGPQINNTSGFLGVTWAANNRKWCAYSKLDGKRIHLGLFDTPAEAGKAASEFRAKHMPFSKDAAKLQEEPQCK